MAAITFYRTRQDKLYRVRHTALDLHIQRLFLRELIPSNAGKIRFAINGRIEFAHDELRKYDPNVERTPLKFFPTEKSPSYAWWAGLRAALHEISKNVRTLSLKRDDYTRDHEAARMPAVASLSAILLYFYMNIFKEKAPRWLSTLVWANKVSLDALPFLVLPSQFFSIKDRTVTAVTTPNGAFLTSCVINVGRLSTFDPYREYHGQKTEQVPEEFVMGESSDKEDIFTPSATILAHKAEIAAQRVADMEEASNHAINEMLETVPSNPMANPDSFTMMAKMREVAEDNERRDVAFRQSEEEHALNKQLSWDDTGDRAADWGRTDLEAITNDPNTIRISKDEIQQIEDAEELAENGDGEDEIGEISDALLDAGIGNVLRPRVQYVLQHPEEFGESIELCNEHLVDERDDLISWKYKVTSEGDLDIGTTAEDFAAAVYVMTRVKTLFENHFHEFVQTFVTSDYVLNFMGISKYISNEMLDTIIANVSEENVKYTVAFGRVAQ